MILFEGKVPNSLILNLAIVGLKMSAEQIHLYEELFEKFKW